MLKTSQKVTPQEMADGVEITSRDVFPFLYPGKEELDAVGVTGIFLGDYIKWDVEKQVEFIKEKFGWQEAPVEGTYKRYKSVECIMPGVHDYLKFLKRGFGRATDHACEDIRYGRLTREEAFELARGYDAQRPHVLDYWLQTTGLTEEEFYRVAESMREPPLRRASESAEPEVGKGRE